MTLARLLYDIFFEGCTHYSMAKVNDAGRLAYYTEEGIPSLALIRQHLNGEVVLGAYTLLPGNMVRWMAFDVDSKADPAKAKEIAYKICKFLGGIRYLIEWSGNKGYHIIIIFDEPVAAVDAKAIGDHIRDVLMLPKSGDPHVEVYPKQDRLTESNPLGNLLRLPLGRHPTTQNWTCFVDPDNGWEEGPEKDPDKLLEQRVTLEQMKNLVKQQDPIEKVVRILLPYWTSGQRHEMALYTAGYLANLGWTQDSVLELVKLLTEECGEGDLDNLLEAVTDTFEKMFRNEKIRGFEGLSERLPNSVLKELSEAASTQTFSATLQMVDRVRLGKGQNFQKVRMSALIAINHFKERGRLVQDVNNVYWLDDQTKSLLAFGGSAWNLYMHANFGLNPVDSFGKQVAEEVRMFSRAEAQTISVHKRSYWDGERAHINLGGPEVYVVDSTSITVAQNGENGVLFLNSEDNLRLPNLMQLEVSPLSPWSFLVNDLSFLTGENASATPTQQRELLKAWIISIFFAQAMPTRPILTLLAAAGAGKTTTARRILRFLEGPAEDVLGVVNDKPDSIRSSLMVHKVLVLDNLEKANKVSWLTDVLNRVSTGSHIEIRKLYETNSVLKIVPNCFVIITATEMPFSEETVFTRMLPIELAPLKTPRPEHQIQVQLLSQMEALWKGMLIDLQEAVRQLKAVKTVEAPNESRLADFTVFCARIQGASFLDGKQLMDGLGSMVSRQRKALQEASPFIQVLEIYIRTRPQDAGEWKNMSELFQVMQKIATTNRMEWRWSSAQGLSRHVGMLEPQLIRHFGMSVRKTRKNGSEVSQYKFVVNTIDT